MWDEPLTADGGGWSMRDSTACVGLGSMAAYLFYAQNAQCEEDFWGKALDNM